MAIKIIYLAYFLKTAGWCWCWFGLAPAFSSYELVELPPGAGLPSHIFFNVLN
jgi:hypothetical protein